MPPLKIPSRILAVCMGNICRSPTVEVVLRKLAINANLAIEVDSAGTADYHVGDPPDPRSIQTARKRGYDLSGLRARQVELNDFQTFDLIFAADSQNLAALNQICPPQLKHKLSLFLDGIPLPDPYYGEDQQFENVLDLVEKRATELVRAWKTLSAPNKLVED